MKSSTAACVAKLLDLTDEIDVTAAKNEYNCFLSAIHKATYESKIASAR